MTSFAQTFETFQFQTPVRLPKHLLCSDFEMAETSGIMTNNSEITQCSKFRSRPIKRHARPQSAMRFVHLASVNITSLVITIQNRALIHAILQVANFSIFQLLLSISNQPICKFLKLLFDYGSFIKLMHITKAD